MLQSQVSFKKTSGIRMISCAPVANRLPACPATSAEFPPLGKPCHARSRPDAERPQAHTGGAQECGAVDPVERGVDFGPRMHTD